MFIPLNSKLVQKHLTMLDVVSSVETICNEQIKMIRFYKRELKYVGTAHIQALTDNINVLNQYLISGLHQISLCYEYMFSLLCFLNPPCLNPMLLKQSNSPFLIITGSRISVKLSQTFSLQRFKARCDQVLQSRIHNLSMDHELS